jgi:hypothetical protein
MSHILVENLSKEFQVAERIRVSGELCADWCGVAIARSVRSTA